MPQDFTQRQNMNTSLIRDLLERLTIKMEELKEMKKAIKEIESDLPMELEDLMLTLKDLKAQVKERKEEHLKLIMENNDEYNELRKQIQLHKEEIAQNKLELFAAATNLSRQHGDIDETVIIEGSPQRLQTQKEVTIYLNGKTVKVA